MIFTGIGLRSAVVQMGFLGVAVVGFFLIAPLQQTTAQEASTSADSELARVSFQRHMNLVIIQGRVDGQGPINFLVDSGAGSSMVLDIESAKKFKLKMGDPIRGGKTAQGGTMTLRFVPQVSFEVGGHAETLKNVLVAPCLGHARTMLGIDVHGIVGTPFLKRVTAEFDYESKEMVLHDPEKYKYSGDGAMLDLEFDPKVSNLPFTTAVFNAKKGGKRKVRMLVDSGGSTLATGGLGLSEDIEQIVPDDAPRVPTQGVSGLADTPEGTIHASYLTRLDRMELGPYVLERPTLSCGSTHSFNLIGGEVLRRFDVVFDYRRKRMILEPNASYKTPLQTDKSGIMLIASTQDVNVRRIQFVTPGSPAVEAGLKQGDVILKINGAASDAQGLQATRELFFKADQRFTLVIKRGEKVMTKELQTRSML